MSVLAWIPLAIVSALLMAVASRIGLRHSVAVARRLRVPPFVVGVSLVAVGTDLPELVNSVVASWLGHGDINVGDSVGSVFTQSTFVLGVFPLIAGAAVLVNRREVLVLSLGTLAGLGVGALLLADGWISRSDALSLLLVWLAATGAAVLVPGGDSPAPAQAGDRHVLVHVGLALLALGVVGAAATGLVFAVSELSAAIGVPEYVLSFLGASIGTSLPELAVEVSALRRGQHQIALGDALGSCMVDASASVALGPLLFPVAVTPALALSGAGLAAAGLALGAVLLAVRRRHDGISAAVLVAGYVAGYLWFLL